MRRLILLPWLTLLTAQAQAQTSSPSVLVSFQPLYDVVSRVAGGQGRVERLVPVGASPHTFDPTVRDVARIRDANLVVMAGLGADAWLEKYVKASGSRAVVLKLGDVMNFSRLRSGTGARAPVDPHWWLDASLMAQANAAVKAGPAGAAARPAPRSTADTSRPAAGTAQPGKGEAATAPQQQNPNPAPAQAGSNPTGKLSDNPLYRSP